MTMRSFSSAAISANQSEAATAFKSALPGFSGQL